MTQFWIDLNTEIANWMDQVERIILMEDSKYIVSEVNT